MAEESRTATGNDPSSSVSENHEEVTLKVKTIDSREYTLVAQRSWTVARFKQEIASQIGEVTPERMRLIVAGRVMKDDQTLQFYNVRSEQVIHLVQRPADTTSSSAAEQRGSLSPSNERTSATEHTAPSTVPHPITPIVHVQVTSSGLHSSQQNTGSNAFAASSQRVLTHPMGGSTRSSYSTVPTAAGNLGHGVMHTAPLGSISAGPVRTPVISDVTLHIHLSMQELEELPRRLEALHQQVPFRLRTDVQTAPIPSSFNPPVPMSRSSNGPFETQPNDSDRAASSRPTTRTAHPRQRPAGQVHHDMNSGVSTPQTSTSNSNSSSNNNNNSGDHSNIPSNSTHAFTSAESHAVPHPPPNTENIPFGLNFLNFSNGVATQLGNANSLGGVVQGLMPMIQSLIQTATGSGSSGNTTIHTVLAAEVPLSGGDLSFTEYQMGDNSTTSSSSSDQNTSATDSSVHFFTNSTSTNTRSTHSSEARPSQQDSSRMETTVHPASNSTTTSSSISLHDLAVQSGIPSESTGSPFDELVSDLLHALEVQDMLQLVMMGNWRVTTRIHPVLMRHLRSISGNDASETGRRRFVRTIQEGLRSVLSSETLVPIFQSAQREGVLAIEETLRASGFVAERLFDFFHQVDDENQALPSNYHDQLRNQFIRASGFLTEYISTEALACQQDFYRIFQSVMTELGHEVLRMNPNFSGPFQIASSMMTTFLRGWHSEYRQMGCYAPDRRACLEAQQGAGSRVTPEIPSGMTWSDADDALLEDALSSVEQQQHTTHRAPQHSLYEAIHRASYFSDAERENWERVLHEDDEAYTAGHHEGLE